MTPAKFMNQFAMFTFPALMCFGGVLGLADRLNRTPTFGNIVYVGYMFTPLLVLAAGIGFVFLVVDAVVPQERGTIAAVACGFAWAAFLFGVWFGPGLDF